MPDWELPAWVGTAGPVVSLGLSIVVAVARGYLIPGKTVDRLEKQWEERLAEARERESQWRALAQEASSQVAILMGVARTTERVVSALPDPAHQEPPS